MNILYLSEDYFYSKVHHSLINALSNINNNITIFTYYRISENAKNLSEIYGERLYELIAIKNESNLFRYKFDFSYKIKTKFKELEKNVDLSKYDLIYASTLFSEGALALKIKIKYNIPYVTAIRGTDVSLYLNKMIHLWSIGRKVVARSGGLLFVSPSLRKCFLNSILFLAKKNELYQKSIVTFNGINTFWLDKFKKREQSKTRAFVFLYVGRFDKNKNIKKMIQSFLHIRKDFNDKIELHLIGSGGEYESFVKDISTQNIGIRHFGPIYDKEVLLNYYYQADAFVMVSHSETFGLVYLEALSTGLPVIYSKEQGVDGLFKEKVGLSAVSTSTSSIESAMLEMINSYSSFDLSPLSMDRFKWASIGQKINDFIKKEND